MSTDEMRALYRRWLPELWHAEPDRMATIAGTVFTPDAVAHWSDGTDRIGPDEIAARLRETVSMFDDVSVSLRRGPLLLQQLDALGWVPSAAAQCDVLCGERDGGAGTARVAGRGAGPTATGDGAEVRAGDGTAMAAVDDAGVVPHQVKKIPAATSSTATATASATRGAT